MKMFVKKMYSHVINQFIRCFHQSRLLNLRIFITNICYYFFFNWPADKKNPFRTNKKFVFFFNCSNWEKFNEKIRETNRWKQLMNSLDVLKMSLILCKKGEKNCIHYWYVLVRTATIVGILTSCQIKSRFKKCYQMILWS